MTGLYPNIQPYATHHLLVTDLHTLYIEETGSPLGLPVIFLHGGPGAGCAPIHRRFFNPERYRIILFDQRGCGKSTPHAELVENHTQALVEDIEMIRSYLKISQWVVFGGSWGSTLGLVYAQMHPSHILGLILRGIFLCRREEIRWFYQQGASRIFPDHWEKFTRIIPPAERNNLLSAYYQRLTSANEIQRLAAAKAWSTWEGATSCLEINQSVIESFTNTHTAISLATIECHYFIHDSFLTPNQILKNTNRLQDIPGIIIHGRYDMICPLMNAWELSDRWPDATLKIIPSAGHSAFEPGITQALVNATNYFAEQYA